MIEKKQLYTNGISLKLTSLVSFSENWPESRGKKSLICSIYGQFDIAVHVQHNQTESLYVL